MPENPLRNPTRLPKSSHGIQWYLPINTRISEHLKAAMSKSAHASAFVFHPKLVALGFGFRCRLLGFVNGDHQDTPRAGNTIGHHRQPNPVGLRSVQTRANTRGDTRNLPDMSVVEQIREPIVKCCVMVPNGNIGDMMQSCSQTRHCRDTESRTRGVMIHKHS